MIEKASVFENNPVRKQDIVSQYPNSQKHIEYSRYCEPPFLFSYAFMCNPCGVRHSKNNACDK